MILKQLIILLIIIFIINCTKNKDLISLNQINRQLIYLMNTLSNESINLNIKYKELKKQNNQLMKMHVDLIKLEKEINYLYTNNVWYRRIN